MYSVTGFCLFCIAYLYGDMYPVARHVVDEPVFPVPLLLTLWESAFIRCFSLNEYNLETSKRSNGRTVFKHTSFL